MADLSTTQNQISIGKYKVLISLILLFLLLTVSMLATSLFATAKLTQATSIIDSASRQGAIIQEMAKNLMDVNLYLNEITQQNDENIETKQLNQQTLYRLKEIQNLQQQFNQNLNAFLNGGELRTASGETLNIEAIKNNPQAIQSLNYTQQIWEPYNGLMNNFLRSNQTGIINKQTSDYLVDYTREYNRALLSEQQHLAVALSNAINQQSKLWRAIQIAGIVIAFILFLFIVFGALRQLMQNDKRLAVANQEMNEIMSSVNEGLFLIDKNFIIAEQYSTRLEDILEQHDIAGKTLFELLTPYLPEEEIETTQTFIEQLYSEWVVEDLIEDLNPISRIKIKSNQSVGLGDEKYLDFRFFRVLHNDKIERVLVRVIDSTETVLLQMNLEQQREKEERETAMLSVIINTDSHLLAQFIKQSKERLEAINQSLEQTNRRHSQNQLREKVSSISKIIHSIKGESSALKLTRMVELCEKLEDILLKLKQKPELTGLDFLSMVVILEELFHLVDVLNNYSKTHPTAPPQIAANNEPAQITQLKTFAQDIAQRSEKKALLLTHDFDSNILPETQLTLLKDITIQLLRNAIVHGIETPENRLKKQKSPTGLIKLSLQDDGESWIFSAEDDGCGINFAKIREKALQRGDYSEAELNNLNQKQLLQLIFREDFSTAEKSNEDAGKGIGMGIIKNSIIKLKGKLSIQTQSDRYTRFTIRFPK